MKLVVVFGLTAAAAGAIALQSARTYRELRATQAEVSTALAVSAQAIDQSLAASWADGVNGMAPAPQDRRRYAAFFVPPAADRSMERSPDAARAAPLRPSATSPSATRRPLSLAPPEGRVDSAPPAGRPASRTTSLSDGASVGRGVVMATEVPAEAGGLPRLPRREQVAALMSSLRPKIQRCYDQGLVPGEITLLLTVSGLTGRVIDAQVSAHSSTSICVRDAARGLRFPPFAQDEATIRYPYVFR